MKFALYGAVAVLLLFQCCSAFHNFPLASRSGLKLAMVFNFFNNKSQPPSKPEIAKASSKVAQTSQATQNTQVSPRFTEYIPSGVSKEQYEMVKAAENQKKEQNKKRFEKGKVTESLTEWLLANEKKGLKGLDLNRKGHKMVKMKYEGWYTDESPV